MAGLVSNKDDSKKRPSGGHVDERSRHHAELSIVGASLTVIGNLESDGEVLVNGTVIGTVRVKKLTIGMSGQITGPIEGGTVIVGGTVTGDIKADHVEISGTARITGDIFHDTLQIETGAHINGRCRPKSEGNGDANLKLTVVATQFEREEPDDA